MASLKMLNNLCVGGFVFLGLLMTPMLVSTSLNLEDLQTLSPGTRQEIEQFLAAKAKADDTDANQNSDDAQMRFSLGPLTTATASVISNVDPIIPSFPFFDDFIEEKRDAITEEIPIDNATWDYIIVGCGASGCPLAGALATIGSRVLVIERGMERSSVNTPNAQNIEGAGIGLSDPTISQPIVTTQGVITFAGAVMGGGSSVNLGIMIAESEAFFDKLAIDYPGFQITYSALDTEFTVINNAVVSFMPVLEPFGPLYSSALINSGYQSLGGGNIPNSSTAPVMGFQWQGGSLFDSTDDFYRKAADFLLPVNTPNLKIMTRTLAQRVVFDNSSGIPVATCVVYRPTTYKDIKTQGITWQLLPSTAADWSPWVGSFFSPKSVMVAVGNSPSPKFRRACLTNPLATNKIILSAGAVQTAALLFRSGIGPQDQLDKLKVPTTLVNANVGSEASDRVFITVSAFLTNYSDDFLLKSLTGGLFLRRLQDGEDTKGKFLKKLKLKTKTDGPLFGKAKTHPAKDSIEIIAVADDPEDIESRFFGSLNPPTILPDYLLYPGKMFAMENDLQPRVCQYTGLAQIGPLCTPNAILDPSLQCSVVPMQELSGGRTAEGFIYASRFVFPPPYRMDPVIDTLIEFLLACANYRSPLNIVALKPFCTLAMPVIKCFRKAVAPFTFNSEPSSRGTIEVLKDGNIIFNPNYLKTEKDLFDAIRGTSTLIDQINSDTYRSIFQPKGPFSCPLTIANGLLDVMLMLGSWTSPLLTNPANFNAIQVYLQDLIPAGSRRLRRLMVVEEGQVLEPNIYVDEQGQEFEDFSHHVHENVDEAKMEQLGIKDALKKSNFDFASYKAHHSEVGDDREATRRLESVFGAAFESENLDNTSAATQTHTHEESMRRLYADSSKGFYSEKDGATEAPTSRPMSSKGVKSEEFLNIFSPFMSKPNLEKQWAATFPPTLPSTANPIAVGKFALTYMTSIGHLYGSAQMGKVVDPNFLVTGTSNLHIVDASILPQLPRMNPTMTLMALGRYAALLL